MFSSLQRRPSAFYIHLQLLVFYFYFYLALANFESYRAGVVGLYKTSTIPYVARDADFTYGTSFPLIWLAAEVSATIIAASIPFFRPLVRLARGTRQQKDTYGSYGLSKVSRPNTNPLVKSHDQLEGDDRSDKFILKPSSHILRQTSITIQHNSETDEEGGRPGIAGRGRRDLY